MTAATRHVPFPTEIIEHILALIRGQGAPNAEGVASLRMSALVSKEWARASQRVLFAVVRIDWHDMREDSRLCFLETRPDLAAFVQQVELHSFDTAMATDPLRTITRLVAALPNTRTFILHPIMLPVEPEVPHESIDPGQVASEVITGFRSLRNLSILYFGHNIKPFDSYRTAYTFASASLVAVRLVTAPCSAIAEFLGVLARTNSRETLQTLHLEFGNWNGPDLASIQTILVHFHTLRVLKVMFLRSPFYHRHPVFVETLRHDISLRDHGHMQELQVGVPCKTNETILFLRALFLRAVLPSLRDVEVTLRTYGTIIIRDNNQLEEVNPIELLSGDQAQLDNQVLPRSIADSLNHLKIKHDYMSAAQTSQFRTIFGVSHRADVLQTECLFRNPCAR